MIKNILTSIFILTTCLNFDKVLCRERLKSRLPGNVVPKIYNLEIEPSDVAEKFTFSGKGEYQIELIQPTSTITLHKAEDLKVKNHSIELISEDGKSHKPTDLKWDKTNEFYEIKFDSEMEPDNYKLKIEWEGRDGADEWHSPRIGFFSAADNRENKAIEPSYILTTRFKGDKARMAFPCWDEPGMKARFILSIKHPTKYNVISNMPVEKVEKWVNNKDLTIFKRSKKMSPHLLSWTISDYKKSDSNMKHASFYSPENQKRNSKFALEISDKVIPAMEKYTQFKYPLPKLDQIAIPEFKGESVENWGAISYLGDEIMLNETMLLPDIKKKDSITYLVSKQIAYQWFNLASPKYWDDSWLGDGMAQYFAYRIIDTIYPDRKVMDEFGVEFMSDAFASDFQLAFPIKYTPNEDMDLDFYKFNEATIKKAAGVLRMLEFVISDEVFRKGIQRFLKKHQYTAVETDDLWDALQGAYDDSFVHFKRIDVKEFMDPWVKLNSYPEISVTKKRNGTAKLTKKRLFSTEEDKNWKIPITYATKSHQENRYLRESIVWMQPHNRSILLPFVNKDDWIIVNVQQKGFYKVKYDENNWKKLIKHLHNDKLSAIHPINRAQLFEDALESYFIYDQHFERLVNLTSYLYREKDYLPWISGIAAIKRLKKDMDNSPAEKEFYSHMLFLMSDIMNSIGYNYEKYENYQTTKTRNFLTPFACTFGHAACRNHAQQLFNKYVENPSSNAFPNKDWDWVLCYGLRESNDDIWTKFITGQLILPKNIDDDKFNYIKCAKTYEKKKKYLKLAMAQDLPTKVFKIEKVLELCLEDSHENVDFVINYVIEDFATLKEFLDSSTSAILMYTSWSTKRREQFEKVKQFLEPHIDEIKKIDKYGLLDDIFGKMEGAANKYQEKSTRFTDVLKTLNIKTT